MLETPLLTSDASSASEIKEIQDKYYQLKKDLNSLNKLSGLPDLQIYKHIGEFSKLKFSIKQNFEFLSKKIKKIRSELEKGENDAESRRNAEKVASIDEGGKLRSMNEGFKKVVEEMDKRFMRYAELSPQNPSEKSETDALESQIKMTQYSNNEKYMSQRTETLEQVKKISSQVAMLSSDMKMEVDNQSSMVNSIENNTGIAEQNTKKAYKEALETEIITRRSKRKLYILYIIIFILIILSVYFLIKLFS